MNYSHSVLHNTTHTGASRPSDYIIIFPAAPSSTVTFNSMVTSANVSIEVMDDSLFEGMEEFNAGLSIPATPVLSGVILNPFARTLNVQIRENDGTCSYIGQLA